MEFGWDLCAEYEQCMLAGMRKILGRSKEWLVISSQLKVQEVICKFKKLFNSSVQIMLASMKIKNYFSLFSYPMVIEGEEILLYPHYYFNLGGLLYCT
jgi:hypothetical protein